jgi:hypothetical protein
MAVTNALTYGTTETNGGAVAELLATEILQQLYDPSDLRAVCSRINYNPLGSDTMQVVQDMVPGAFSAPGENATLNATAYATTHFDIQLVQYRRAYAAADMLPVSGSPIDINRMVSNLMEGVALTFTDIICDVFPSFTAQAGATGVNLSVDDIYDGIFSLNSALNAGPYTCVLHPTQWNHFISSLRAEVGAAQFAPATAAMLAQKGPGYRGQWMGVDFYVSDSVDTNGTDRIGGIFGSGAIAYAMGNVAAMSGMVPASNLIVDAGELVVELDRTAADGVTAAYATMVMGVSLAEDARGCEILSVD